MARYRTINVDLNRQYRNDLNANFAQIEQDIIGQENFTVEMKNSLLTELARIEQDSIDRDNILARQNLEVLLQSIEDAKANANTSASNANTKANYAQTQGDYAKSQGDFAKTQGENAQIKAEYANEKAVLADEAAGNANLEASNLSQLKIDVVTATQNANTATTNADVATINANNAASYATIQGDYAKQQAERAQDIVDGTGLLTETDIGEKVAGFNANGQVLDKNGNVVEGKVKSVNNVQPDTNGNITIDIPEPDLSGYATTEQLSSHASNESIHTTQAEKDKLAGIETGANKYTHPTSHPASMITIADASNLFTSENVEGALSELFTNVSNGKNQIATAITDNGVSANGSDSFIQLASKIGQISGGAKVAMGTTTISSTGNVTVGGLAFKPQFVVISNANYGSQPTHFNSMAITEELKNMYMSITYANNTGYIGLLSSVENLTSENFSYTDNSFTIKAHVNVNKSLKWLAIGGIS